MLFYFVTLNFLKRKMLIFVVTHKGILSTCVMLPGVSEPSLKNFLSLVCLYLIVAVRYRDPGLIKESSLEGWFHGTQPIAIGIRISNGKPVCSKV